MNYKQSEYTKMSYTEFRDFIKSIINVDLVWACKKEGDSAGVCYEKLKSIFQDRNVFFTYYNDVVKQTSKWYIIRFALEKDSENRRWRPLYHIIFSQVKRNQSYPNTECSYQRLDELLLESDYENKHYKFGVLTKHLKK